MRPDLYRLLYPLDGAEQDEWAATVHLPRGEFEDRLRQAAEAHGCTQENHGEYLAWMGPAGNPELLMFRIPDPGNLAAVRNIYAVIEETNCPMAYAFVNQRGDSVDAWDVFQFSRLSYLCHCNRIAGPGSSCEP